MQEILLVGLGSFIGGIARYLLTGVTLRILSQPQFPFGTLLVNLIGCFLIGVLGSLADRGEFLTPNTKLLILTGMLGGFTTFSAFAYESLVLSKSGNMTSTILYVATSVVLCLLACSLGAKVSNFSSL